MTPLAAKLDQLAKAGKTLAYGELARELQMRIGDLTAALEEMMADDARSGQPLRAALCRSRLSDMPALGFFDAARQLGCYNGPPDGEDARDFVTKTRSALFDQARTG